MIYIKLDRLFHLQGELTDAEFARKLGVSRTQLWRVKNKHSAVGQNFLEKFMLVYPEMTINDYFFVKGVPLATQPKDVQANSPC